MAANQAYVLTINGGSSSIKFALFESPQTENDVSIHCVLSGKMTGIGSSQLHINASLHQGDLEKLEESGILKRASLETQDYSLTERANQSPIHLLLQWINTHIDTNLLLAVGHRVVHGGPLYREAEIVTPAMLTTLEEWVAIDPEHLPEEISLIKAIAKDMPDVLQIACFDTAFHRSLPKVAQLLAIPRRYFNQGIRRYGFHGLSYTFLLQELRHLEGSRRASGRVIMAHLGNGASLTAAYQGKSVDTSMGLTPTAGLPMGSRSGDLDPGLYAYLAQTEQMSAAAFQHMVNHESGLLGISEISSDIRELLLHEHDDQRAADAVELFCYQTKKWICALAGALKGVDTIIFTGGIGENLSEIRARVCAGLEFMGIKLDAQKNNTNAAAISAADSQVLTMVIPTNEELVIAQQVYPLVGQSELRKADIPQYALVSQIRRAHH
ncbi:acetate/propionate family kinase [Cellvibrio sp. ARAG 10.3]|uniref:acetate/propionate family kinase n=1 Tax=Cellvibrio sp. ARAG 10.3 TaxID=3451358 RepID=UPI003F45F079